jgi:hypothetical protein
MTLNGGKPQAVGIAGMARMGGAMRWAGRPAWRQNCPALASILIKDQL